ncbi:MAG: thermonuclease family protein [bacterium]|nr:thermonuclease family protein [bacterium]
MARSAKANKQRRLIQIALVISLAILFLVVRFVERVDEEGEPGDRFEIVRVSDGDSMELRGGDRLRLLAVDTPEKREPLYQEATNFTSDLTLNKIGRLVYAGARRDKYGRLLAFLYIDSVLINEQILRNGLGYLYLFKDTDLDRPEVRLMLQAQREAIDSKIGLWAIERAPEPYYVAAAGAFRLHRPGCRSIRKLAPHNSRIFDTREEGLRTGLSPCRNCKP